MELKGHRSINLLAGEIAPGKVWIHIGTTHTSTTEPLRALARMLAADGHRVGYVILDDRVGIAEALAAVGPDVPIVNLDDVEDYEVVIIEPSKVPGRRLLSPNLLPPPQPSEEGLDPYPALRTKTRIVGVTIVDHLMETNVPCSVFTADLLSYSFHGKDGIQIRTWKGL